MKMTSKFQRSAEIVSGILKRMGGFDRGSLVSGRKLHGGCRSVYGKSTRGILVNSLQLYVC
jgi:hypothetical protein